MIRTFNPTLLRGNLVTFLRGMDEVVGLIGGDPDNIVEFIEQDRGDLVRTIDGLKPPKMLVHLTDISTEGGPGLIRAGISIAVRAGDPFVLLEKLLNGTSTALGIADAQLLGSVLVPHVSPAKFQGMTRHLIYIAEFRSFDYWEIRLLFIDKG